MSPYALTKRADEEWAKQYSRHYGLKTIGLRYFNVFGRRQDPHGAYAAVIPKFIKQLLNDEQPTINGDGKQSRDFTYVENVIEANLKACLAPDEASGQKVRFLRRLLRLKLDKVMWKTRQRKLLKKPQILLKL